MLGSASYFACSALCSRNVDDAFRATGAFARWNTPARHGTRDDDAADSDSSCAVAFK
jgi:hypothetical protein